MLQSSIFLYIPLWFITDCHTNYLQLRLSFSFGRALQASALKAWNGSDVAAGQDQLIRWQKKFIVLTNN